MLSLNGIYQGICTGASSLYNGVTGFFTVAPVMDVPQVSHFNQLQGVPESRQLVRLKAAVERAILNTQSLGSEHIGRLASLVNERNEEVESVTLLEAPKEISFLTKVGHFLSPPGKTISDKIAGRHEVLRERMKGVYSEWDTVIGEVNKMADILPILKEAVDLAEGGAPSLEEAPRVIAEAPEDEEEVTSDIGGGGRPSAADFEAVLAPQKQILSRYDYMKCIAETLVDQYIEFIKLDAPVLAGQLQSGKVSLGEAKEYSLLYRKILPLTFDPNITLPLDAKINEKENAFLGDYFSGSMMSAALLATVTVGGLGLLKMGYFK